MASDSFPTRKSTSITRFNHLTRVGKAKAMYYVLTGKAFGAEEAERIGMITKAVEDGKHLEEALEIANVIASNPRLAVLAGKESVNQQAETPLIPENGKVSAYRIKLKVSFKYRTD